MTAWLQCHFSFSPRGVTDSKQACICLPQGMVNLLQKLTMHKCLLTQHVSRFLNILFLQLRPFHVTSPNLQSYKLPSFWQRPCKIWAIMRHRYYNVASLFPRYRILILVFTFVGYMSYHLSRKPISVVKTELFNCTHPNVTLGLSGDGDDGVNCTSWICKMAEWVRLIQTSPLTVTQ